MSKLHILQHSLGLDEYGAGRQYRNHFVTGPGSTDFDICKSMVADGLMTQTAGNAITGGDDVFRVTPTGIDYVALHSPDKPVAPKLTRGQSNYRDFLARDGVESFAEFMGFKQRRRS